MKVYIYNERGIQILSIECDKILKVDGNTILIKKGETAAIIPPTLMVVEDSCHKYLNSEK